MRRQFTSSEEATRAGFAEGERLARLHNRVTLRNWLIWILIGIVLTVIFVSGV